MVSMKMDTALLVQVESSTVVSIKMNTVWQVQVAGSTVDCMTLDVAGANFSWALDSSGPKSDWAYALWIFGKPNSDWALSGCP